MSDSLREYRNYAIAAAALTALVWVPAAVLFIVSLFTARRRSDPARSWLIWLKLALVFFSWFCLFEVVTYALYVALVTLVDRSYFFDNDDVLDQARLQVGTLTSYFEKMVDILLMLLLVSVGGGITTAMSGTPSKVARIYKFISWGLAVVLAILALAALGLGIRVNVYQFGGFSYDDYRELIRQYDAVVHLTFATWVILWAVSISMFIWACQVRFASKGDSRVTTAGTFLVVSSFLFLVKMTTTVAMYLAYVDIRSPSTNSKEYDIFADIIRVIFSTWPAFVIMVLLYVLGVKKGDKGLWSSGSAPYDREAYGAAVPHQQQQYQAYPHPTQYQPHEPAPSTASPPMQQQQQQYYSPNDYQQHSHVADNGYNYSSPPIPAAYK